MLTGVDNKQGKVQISLFSIKYLKLRQKDVKTFRGPAIPCITECPLWCLTSPFIACLGALYRRECI